MNLRVNELSRSSKETMVRRFDHKCLCQLQKLKCRDINLLKVRENTSPIVTKICFRRFGLLRKPSSFTDEGFRRRPKRLKQIFVTIGLVFSQTLSMDLLSHSGLYHTATCNVIKWVRVSSSFLTESASLHPIWLNSLNFVYNNLLRIPGHLL